jgi:hypothetical protein
VTSKRPGQGTHSLPPSSSDGERLSPAESGLSDTLPQPLWRKNGDGCTRRQLQSELRTAERDDSDHTARLVEQVTHGDAVATDRLLEQHLPTLRAFVRLHAVAAPSFVAPGVDFHIRPRDPGRDRGLSGPAWVPGTDLDGQARPAFGVDIGADELDQR